MSRNIKSLIVGLSDSPVIKEEWNITPVTTTTTPELAIVSSHNCNVVSGEVIADVTGVTEGNYISAVKTNITMQGLETDKTIKFGFEATDVPGLSPCVIGIYIAPGNMSVTVVANEVNDIMLLGQPPSNNRIIHCSLLFNTTYQAPTRYRIPNAANPNGVGGVLTNLAAGLSDLAVGSKSGMLLSRRNNNLYIGRFDVKSDGSSYDLNGREAVVNGPVFDNTLTVFFFTISADMGNGLQNIAYIPSVTLDSPAYDVTGTSASLTPPPSDVDWANFINPVRPSFSQVNQATLPVDARVDQLYRVVIDPSYTGPDPTPYGYPLKNNQTILINNISGNGAITALVDNETLIELTNDILSPVVAQQVTMLQSIADIGNLLQQTQDDINVALLNAPEAVVYVKPETTVSPASDRDFSTSVSFSTFHAAYGYLTQLPKFIKKRIVLDDRQGGSVNGEAGFIYQLMENNINISTYRCYTKHYIDLTAMTLPSVFMLYIDCTGLSVDKFAGGFNAQSTKIPGTYWNVGELPADASLLQSRLIIGDDTYLSISDNGIILNQQPTYIKLGERSYLLMRIFAGIVATGVKRITVRRGNNSKVDILQGTLLTDHPTLLPFVKVIRPHDNSDDTLQFTPASISIEYSDNDPLADGYSGFRIIRGLQDLGAKDGFGDYNLTSGAKYLFAKSLELGSASIRIPSGYTATLEALPGVSVYNNGDKPVLDVRGTCYDYGVTWVLRASITTMPIIQNRGKYYRKGGKVQGCKLIESYPDPLYNSPTELHILDVEHLPDPTYAGILNASEIGDCKHLVVRNMKIRGLTPHTISLFTFNINSLDASNHYELDGITYRVGNTPIIGVVNIVNAYGKNSTTIAEVIILKNIQAKSGGLLAQGPLVTRDGIPYPYYTDPAFDFDDRKRGLLIINGTGNAAEGGGKPSPVIISSAVLEEYGFYRDSSFAEYFKFISRKYSARFIATLTADVYRTASSGNAMVSISTLNPITNSVSGDIYNFTLPSANTRVPIQITVPITALPYAHYVMLRCGLSGNSGDLFMEKVMFRIQEI